MTVGSYVVWSSRNGEEHGDIEGKGGEVWGMGAHDSPSSLGRFVVDVYFVMTLVIWWDVESVVVIIVAWAWTYFHGFLLLGSNTHHRTLVLGHAITHSLIDLYHTQLMEDFCEKLCYSQQNENVFLEASLSFLHLTAEFWVVKRSSFMLLLGQSPSKMGFTLTNYYSPREIGWAQLYSLSAQCLLQMWL